jgi:molybdenum cofactor synthesis domain-containing protein
VDSLDPKTPSPERSPDKGIAGPKVRPDRSGPIHVEIVAVGRELLRGRLGESNAKKIAETLAHRGGLVHRITIVDDNDRAIRSAVREALDRNPHLVITTGGLGPAPDDRTLAAVAEALGLPMTLSPRAQGLVEGAYQRLRQSRFTATAGMNLSRQKMCHIPLGSTPLANERGVTPGVLCRLTGGASVLCLPGNPSEMAVVLGEALEELGEPPRKTEIAYREVESPTADESSLRPILERLADEYGGVWVSSRTIGPGRQGHKVLVTFEAVAPTIEDANSMVNNAVRRLLALASGSK